MIGLLIIPVLILTIAELKLVLPIVKTTIITIVGDSDQHDFKNVDAVPTSSVNDQNEEMPCSPNE